tara:strand:- start:176 stop:733 length:558 start_codon:yes stop_codon:yes gene_type:complete
MRVIGGKYKGRIIDFVKSSTTRPLKDSVKENIFNIITHSNLINIKIQNSIILDLYSGIGSFGLECLSRGAKKVIFVERNKEVLKILKNNLVKLSLETSSRIYAEELIKFLQIKKLEKFEIFFLDPPFTDKDYLEILKTIKLKKIYKKNHLIVIHRENKVQDNLENIVKILMVKKYGRSMIFFAKF